MLLLELLDDRLENDELGLGLETRLLEVGDDWVDEVDADDRVEVVGVGLDPAAGVAC